jgi:hypothetical protein
MIASLIVAFVVPLLAIADESPTRDIELRSEVLVAGLTLAESPKEIFAVRIVGRVDGNGDGKGTLELDPNGYKYDEFGFPTVDNSQPTLKLDCKFKFSSRRKVKLEPVAAAAEVEYTRLAIEGPKITTKLCLVHEANSDDWGRFLVYGKDGKVRYAVSMSGPPRLPPCHPGCFPAGTPILTPDGPRPIESIRKGETVTTIGADGKAAREKVASVYTTRNRLIEVRTDAGKLTSTTTQPLALVDGTLRGAGELTPGDRIWKWDGRERKAVVVKSIVPTGRETTVYNLVVGDKAVFIADGFLARSKPPATDKP